MGFTVVEAGLDLGAPMQYCSGHRNRVLQQRIKSLGPYWQKLRRLRVSSWHKRLAVQLALLPRALHGCSHVTLGHHWISKLRTAIMRALGTDRAGASPVIRLGFINDLDTEPSYFVAWQVFRDFVTFFQRNGWFRSQWFAYLESRGVRSTFGPFACFLRVLEQLGWTLTSGDVLNLGFGFTISLSFIDLRSFRRLFRYLWSQQLTYAVNQRVGFEDLVGLNRLACFSHLPDLSGSQVSLLNCAKDGTFFLRSLKAKFDHTHSPLCPCGLAVDTLSHRALDCPRFAAQRSSFQDVVQMWHSLPDCMVQHGLCPENPFQQRYWALLQQIPVDEPDWPVLPTLTVRQHLFTDGSCIFPEIPEHSLASWTVVNATQQAPLASGILPGFFQTINRAELFAVIQAIRWLISVNCHGTVYTDSGYVYAGLTHLLRSPSVPVEWRHQDLWDLLLQTLVMLRTDFDIVKVKAHQTEDPLTAYDSWLRYWNEVADRNAKLAAATFAGVQLRETHASLLSVHSWQSYWSVRCQQFLIALGAASWPTAGWAQQVQTSDGVSERPPVMRPRRLHICG
eukprot:Skav202092  [mRNA]  locus=scaffold513:196764:199222:- [translate_table: standard]